MTTKHFYLCNKAVQLPYFAPFAIFCPSLRGHWDSESGCCTIYLESRAEYEKCVKMIQDAREEAEKAGQSTFFCPYDLELEPTTYLGVTIYTVKSCKIHPDRFCAAK